MVLFNPYSSLEMKAFFLMMVVPTCPSGQERSQGRLMVIFAFKQISRSRFHGASKDAKLNLQKKSNSFKLSGMKEK